MQNQLTKQGLIVNPHLYIQNYFKQQIKNHKNALHLEMFSVFNYFFNYIQ